MIIASVTIAAIAALAVPGKAPDTRLTFNGLTGQSTWADVQARFPSANHKRVCKGETSRFASGVTRCEFLHVPTYTLAGYDFEVSFFFHESGALQSAALNWPAITPERTLPSDQEIENAYWALVDLLISKYGRHITKPPCSYIGGRCQEWQTDGSLDWHTGGERIEIEYDVDALTMQGVRLKYSFADLKSFDRF